MSELQDYRLTVDKPGYGKKGQRVRLHPRAAEALVMGGVMVALADWPAEHGTTGPDDIPTRAGDGAVATGRDGRGKGGGAKVKPSGEE